MLTLLIVDDELSVLEVFYRIVNNVYGQEHFVLKTTDSREAKEIIKTQEINLLLTDIRMPGIDGLALAKYAKDTYPLCKVMILTGYNEFEYAYEALKMGCDDFLLKTASNAEILASVDRIIQDLQKESEQFELMKELESYKRFSKPQDNVEDSIISVVQQYVWKNISTEITLNRISQKVGLNPSYLSRLYRQVTGITLTEYILHVRMRTAQELLVNTTLQIQNIATKVGIESPAYFARVFRKETGYSPQEYRIKQLLRQ